MTLEALRDGLAADGCNQTDQVIALITVCIEDGIDTGSEIVSTVSGLGFKKRYVGLLLNKNTGENQNLKQWYRTAEGKYQLHQ